MTKEYATELFIKFMFKIIRKREKEKRKKKSEFETDKYLLERRLRRGYIVNNNIRICPPRIGKRGSGMADRFAQGFHKSSHCVPPGELPDGGAFRSRETRSIKERERERELRMGFSSEKSD